MTEGIAGMRWGQDDRPRTAQAVDAERTAGQQAGDQPPLLWREVLDGWICTLNIERFRAQIATATDERQRAVLLRLLGEHEAEFQRLSSAAEPEEPTGEARE